MPNALASPAMMRPVQELASSARSPYTRMQPWLIDKSEFGTMRSGSISIVVPRPLHSVHIPRGLLNEND
jgi:hypothetical protein